MDAIIVPNKLAKYKATTGLKTALYASALLKNSGNGRVFTKFVKSIKNKFARASKNINTTTCDLVLYVAKTSLKTNTAI